MNSDSQGQWKRSGACHTPLQFNTLVGCALSLLIFTPFELHAQTHPADIAAKEHERRLQEEFRRQEQFDSQRVAPDVFLQPAIEPTKTNDTPDKNCFNIETIKVTGVVAFDNAVIDRLTAVYRHRCLGLTDIHLLMKDIGNLYLTKGLVTSRAFVQPQNLADGELEVLVVEGTLETLESASKTLSARQLQWAFPVQQGQTLNLRDLEQGLEQLNRLQQNRSELDIQPGSKIGTSRAIIRNPELSAWHLGSGLNNSGSKATGEWLASAYLSWDNPINLNDNVYLSANQAIDSDEYAKSKSLALAYSLPVGYVLYSYNTNYFEYQQRVKTNTVEVITRGDSFNQSFTADYTLWRSQKDKLAISSSLTRKQSRNYLADVVLDSSSRVLYIIDAGATYTRPLPQGVFRTTVQWYRSVQWFGAETEVVKKELDFQFDKYTLDMSLNTAFKLFDKPFSYLSTLHVLYSPKAIIASEGLSLGGRYSIRGIEGEGLSGYKGGYWRNEISYTGALLGSRLTTFAGIDVGQSDTPDVDDGAAWLAGSALGFRVAAPQMNLDLSYAQALHVPEFIQGDTHGFYATLQLNF